MRTFYMTRKGRVDCSIASAVESSCNLEDQNADEAIIRQAKFIGLIVEKLVEMGKIEVHELRNLLDYRHTVEKDEDEWS